jgi:hypothetical protein
MLGRGRKIRPVSAQANYSAMKRNEFVAAIGGIPHLCDENGPCLFTTMGRASDYAHRLGGEAYKIRGNTLYMIRFN